MEQNTGPLIEACWTKTNNPTPAPCECKPFNIQDVYQLTTMLCDTLHKERSPYSTHSVSPWTNPISGADMGTFFRPG